MGHLGNLECNSREIITPDDLISPIASNTSKYYPTTNCTWIVKAPPGKSILLKFESFQLEYSIRCSFDYVAIYSGLFINKEDRLALLCGNLNNALPEIKSKNESMTITFHSDESREYDGFKAKILFITNCGSNIELNSGSQIFSTPNNLNDEPLYCEWIIQAPSNSIIKLNITDIELPNNISESNENQTEPCSGNYLEIRDGEGPFSELINRYCENVPPPQSIVSSSKSMRIKLVTDGLKNVYGVRGILEKLESPCGQSILTVENQPKELISPQLPTNKYNAEVLRCRWTLVYPGPKNWKIINVHFQEFNIEESKNCTEEKLSISDKNNRNYINKPLGQDLIFFGVPQFSEFRPIDRYVPRATYSYCGNRQSMHDYYSAGREEIEIKYQSTRNLEPGQTRFKLNYSFSTCNHNFTDIQGRILHEAVIDCSFTITAPIGYTISLYFNDINLNSEEDCTKSVLEIRDGDFSDNILTNLCGTISPISIYSTGNKLSFHSQLTYYLVTYGSYDITYTTTDKGRGCGGKLFNYLGRFTSPFYPGPYRNENQCIWEVSVPTGFVVSLEFQKFDIGSKETCDTDFLQVEDVLPNGETLPPKKYCGGDKPGIYYSTVDTVLVNYNTTINNGGIGWLIVFTALPYDHQI